MTPQPAEKHQYVAYCRVSTREQGDSGLGLAGQLDACRRFVEGRNGEIILPPFKEVESGKKNRRPELAKAIKKCRTTGATLLISRLDRLSRNAAFLMTLKDSGVDLAVADMPDSNTLMFTIMAGVAQYEAELISSRTKAALAAKKAQGFKLGPRNWNGPDISRWHEEGEKANKASADKAAESVREDIERLAETRTTLRAIANALNDARIMTPSDFKRFERNKKKGVREVRKRTLWSAQGVKNVIKRLEIKIAA
jgi:DNA invertase Pin-like site-specific DNA recombinase